MSLLLVCEGEKTPMVRPAVQVVGVLYSVLALHPSALSDSGVQQNIYDNLDQGSLLLGCELSN